MAEPAVTVLTAVRNGAAHIAEAIESVRAQTFDDHEYVIVDDASQDETPAIVESHSRDDPRIRLVRRDVAGGPYVAANTGLACARGEFLVRIDADDLAVPHRIERQVAFLSSHASLDACASLVSIKTDDVLIDHGIGALPMRPRTLKWRLCVRPGLVHSTACVRTQAFRELGGYRELPLAQDYRMWCDFARDDRLGIVSEVLTYWRRHGGQVTNERADAQLAAARDVLHDHLAALTSGTWSEQDLRLLWRVGLEALPARTGTRVIARFASLWRSDGSLDEDDRRELRALTQRLRREHLKHVAWAGVDRFAVGRSLLRRRARVRSATR